MLRRSCILDSVCFWLSDHVVTWCSHLAWSWEVFHKMSNSFVVITQNIMERLFHYKNDISTSHNPLADGLNIYVDAACKKWNYTSNYLHIKQSQLINIQGNWNLRVVLSLQPVRAGPSHFHDLEESFPNWRKLVPIFCCLNFLKDEITNFEALGANVACMIMPHHLLVHSSSNLVKSLTQESLECSS
jgi:hypothetical protein